MTDSYTVRIHIPARADIPEAGETVEFEVTGDEYILSRAREEGVWLPADCQQGWCTACAARVIDGGLDHADATRWYDEDEAAGFSLLCRAKATSDVFLESHAEEALLDERAAHDLPPGTSKR